MSKLALCGMILVLACTIPAHAQVLGRLKDKVKTKVDQRADSKADQAVDKSLDHVENAAKPSPATEKEKTKTKTEAPAADNTTATAATPAAMKSYSNYDFVPGDKILFEDHFTDDQDGEFAAHWELNAGQAVLNKMDGELAMKLTDGNYARVFPRMKTEKYLSDPFTIEYDFYHLPDAYGVLLLFTVYNKQGGFDQESGMMLSGAEADFDGSVGGVTLHKDYPAELHSNFDNKWHHVAIAVRNHQMKVYIDQYRVLVVPDTKEDFTKVTWAGIGNDDNPIIFKNVRVALGGSMNMIGKKFTDARIVTHGINFDVDRSTIRPESMGTLNMIVQVMKDNPDIRFEVDGHTDNTGTAQHNLTLSQQRADAVRDALVKMGVDASRLTSKGFGDTKPVSDNTSLEGKANNRRVEFVKM